MGVVVGHATHRGRVREKNEDNYCILLPPVVAEGIDALLAVADGMGGHQAGEVASSYVVQGLSKLFSSLEYRRWVDYSPEHGDYYVAALKAVLERLNEGLYGAATSQPNLRGMGTTATVFLLSRGRMFLGHVGDSRAYLLRDGAMKQLTQDHSWVAEQTRDGLMTPEEAAQHPQKNVLTRCLGNGLLVRVDRMSEQVCSGDALILCTDGLSNVVADREIAQSAALPDPQRACDHLVELANQRGGPDNIAVVIARLVDHLPRPSLPTGPVLGHTPGVDQAAITQKIMRQTVSQDRRGQTRGVSSRALTMTGLVAGLGMIASAAALLLHSVPQIAFAMRPAALGAVAASLVFCGVVLLFVGSQIARR